VTDQLSNVIGDLHVCSYTVPENLSRLLLDCLLGETMRSAATTGTRTLAAHGAGGRAGSRVAAGREAASEQQSEGYRTLYLARVIQITRDGDG
jgi:hypothetical protein